MDPNGDSGEYVSSRYNFYVPIGDATLLYNASTAAILRLDGPDAAELASALCIGIFEVATGDLPAGLMEHLTGGGFLLPSGTDEVAEIRQRYWSARRRTPMVVTLTTTMDCNLACYYCYEARSGAALGARDVPAIVAWTRERLCASPEDGLHVDWYGGEPLLNAEFIEVASEALQGLCRSLAAPYSASIISNGTAWPSDAAEFVRRHRIRQIQISFDGLRENHDRRRRYRGVESNSGDSSFDAAATLVDRLLDHARVDLRLNLDRRNLGDLLPFVEFARERGWFSRRYPAVIQPARLAAFSERSAFMRGFELNVEEYDRAREDLRLAATNVRIEIGRASCRERVYVLV